MKKRIISAFLALATAISLSACNAKTEDIEANQAEITIKQEETQKAETTKKETTAETTTAETTITEPEKSEKDLLIQDIIAEVNRTYDTSYKEAYIDEKIAFWNMNGYNYIYNLSTKKVDTSNTYKLYYNEKIYTVGGWSFEVSDLNGNITVPKVNSFYSLLEDGNILYGDCNSYECKIISPDNKNIATLPRLSIDVGHGVTEDKYIVDTYCRYNNKVYVSYQNNNYRIVDLKTMAIEEISDDHKDILNCKPRQIAGKYFQHSFGWLVNLETMETYEITGDGTSFFTKGGYYYEDGQKLMKYITEENSEVIYDGGNKQTYYQVLSDDYFIVMDEIGTFLVDMKTGEETEIVCE